MRIQLSAIAVAISLTLTHQVASANSVASATLGPISVTLIDLNPADSLLPTITWNNATYAPYNNYTYVYAYDSANGNYQSNAAWGENLGSNNSLSASTAQSAATASISSGNDNTRLDGVSLTSAGYADGTTSAGQYSYFNAAAYAPYYGGYDAFTLGAFTGVIFTAYATTSAQTSIGNHDGWGSEYASSTAALNVWGSQPSGTGGTQNSNASISSYAAYDTLSVWNDQTQTYDYSYTGQSNTAADMLGGTYINLTGSDKVGYLQFYTNVSGHSYVASAVAEPESYALVLAGLSLMGMISRRKQK